MGVDDQQGRLRAPLGFVDQAAERGGKARDDRKLVGGAEPLKVMGRDIERLTVLSIQALLVHDLARLFELVYLFFQPLGEIVS